MTTASGCTTLENPVVAMPPTAAIIKLASVFFIWCFCPLWLRVTLAAVASIRPPGKVLQPLQNGTTMPRDVQVEVKIF